MQHNRRERTRDTSYRVVRGGGVMSRKGIILLIIIILLITNVVYAENIKIDVDGIPVEGVRRGDTYLVSLEELAKSKKIKAGWDEDVYIIYGIRGENIQFLEDGKGIQKFGRNLYLDISYIGDYIEGAVFYIDDGGAEINIETKGLDVGGPGSVSVVSDGIGGVYEHFYDFGIPSYQDMPEVVNCRDDFDELLYYGGIAAGIDPVFLKVIMSKESGGNPNVKDNHNKNGTIDVGIMQINSGMHPVLGIQGKAAVDELRSNHLMNIWASTEILKIKMKGLDGRVCKNCMGHPLNKDSFNLFWAYNGISKAGYNYAVDASSRYMRALKIYGSVDVPIYVKLFSNVAYAARDRIPLDDFVTNQTQMSFDEFADIVEKISNGTIVPNRYQLDDKLRQKALKKLADDSLSTGIEGEIQGKDALDDYTIYLTVIKIVKYINKAITIVIFIGTLYLVLVWGMWVLGRLGLGFFDKVIQKLSRKTLSVMDEGSLSKMIKITITDIIVLSLVISGLMVRVLEVLIVNLFYLFI